MSPASANARPVRRAMFWSALIVLLTAGYFQPQWPGWNVNSQLDMTYALVERGTLRIDAYHDRPGDELFTNDKAFVGGHFYTDKSPVTPLLGVPAFAAYRWVADFVPGSFSYAAARYWTTWLTIGLAAALLAAMTTLLLARLGAAPVTASRASALWIAGTPLVAYAVLFFNYLPACAFALGGFMLARRAWSGEPAGKRIFYFAGVLVGLSVWTLNTVAVLAILLTVALVSVPAGSLGERWRRLWPWALGGVTGAAGHFIYVKAIFGTFGSPYAFEHDPEFLEAMGKGLMGAGWPRPLVAWLITFSPFQGLFLWWPLTLAALIGCAWMIARGRRAERVDSIVAVAFLALLIAYTSGYYMWWGGKAFVPRHLIPAIGILVVGLAPLLRARRWGYLVLAFGIIGALLNFAPVGLDPQPWVRLDKELLLRPETVGAWPSVMIFMQGAVWLGGNISPNWGTALGLEGGLSILPLIAMWIVFWIVPPIENALRKNKIQPTD